MLFAFWCIIKSAAPARNVLVTGHASPLQESPAGQWLFSIPNLLFRLTEERPAVGIAGVQWPNGAPSLSRLPWRLPAGNGELLVSHLQTLARACPDVRQGDPCSDAYGLVYSIWRGTSFSAARRYPHTQWSQLSSLLMSVT
jgi:hypothetical protein